MPKIEEPLKSKPTGLGKLCLPIQKDHTVFCKILQIRYIIIFMDHNYTVTIIICILSMIILAIDVGKNTILNKDDIRWFRITF